MKTTKGNAKISLKHGYTLDIDEDNILYLKVETEDDILYFDGKDGDIWDSSDFESLSATEETLRIPLEKSIEYAREMFKDYGIEDEVIEAIVKDLTPWFEKFAVEEREPDAWEKVLLDRIEEWELKERKHYKGISETAEWFKKWVAEADEYEIVDNAEFKAKQVNEARETYRAVWNELMKAKSELEQYRETMGLQ